MLKHTACVIDDGTPFMVLDFFGAYSVDGYAYQTWGEISAEQMLDRRIVSHNRQCVSNDRDRRAAKLKREREESDVFYAKMRVDNRARMDQIRQQLNYGRNKRRRWHRFNQWDKRYWRRANCEFRDRRHMLTLKEQLADTTTPTPETTVCDDGLEVTFINGCAHLAVTDEILFYEEYRQPA